MYNIVIVGAGGFGREIYLYAKESFPDNQYKIKGFLDDNNEALKGYDIDIGIIGSIDAYIPEEKDRFLIAIGTVDIKKSIINKLKKKCAKFLTLIHPTALIADNSIIGEGAIICPFCIVSDSVELNDFVTMTFYSSCGHDSKVGKYCILSPYAIVTGFGVLEDEVFLGAHSTVIPGKKVGCKSKVSANSVVSMNVSANRTVIGVPGKAIQMIWKA
ncbi:acetyltransferase [bacterium]|nr:acetyltransferase [bacterium]